MAYRDGPFENLKVPLAWTAALAVVIVLVAAVLLLLNDRRDNQTAEAYGPARGGFDQAAAPVGGLFAAPVRWAGAVSDYFSDYWNAIDENRRLKKRIVELERSHDQVIALRNVNARYEAMLGIRTEPEVPLLTARSVSESRGPFARSRLLDVGSDKGVRVGNPVINENGLVGRIVGATGGVSRMLLLTDVASKTPVLIDRSDARAMLVGDGSGNPRLEYVRGADAIKSGDRVLSSGDGGLFPRGVPVGVAARGIDGTWRVKLFSDRGAIDYVRVMLFEDFSQLADPEALNAPPLAGLDTAPAPTAEAAAAIRDAQTRRQAASSSTAPAQTPPRPSTAVPPPGDAQ